jgi:TATA-box binding protein (TBP) (component of TFIID and TFIIIB)
MSYPLISPEMSPLNLVTMTVNFHLKKNLNLKVIAEGLDIDKNIKGIKYQSIYKGSYAVQINKKKSSKKRNAGSFKNQCTFRIDVGDKEVNTKLFNNGNMVNAGCLSEQHAITTTKTIIDKIHNIEKEICYEIPPSFINKNINKFFKDDIRKRNSLLYQTLITYFELDTNLECFDPCMSNEDCFPIFRYLADNDKTFQSDIMYINTVISILKSYYNDDICLLSVFDTPEFQYLLYLIETGTNRSKNIIKAVFPSYLNNHEKIDLDLSEIRIDLINQSTKCNYKLKREKLYEIINDMIPKNITDDMVYYVSSCIYDKSNYAGVKIQYVVPNKTVKIIVFDTGKINITATKSHQQVVDAYNFIKEICSKHFHSLLLKTSYVTESSGENELPDQHFTGSDSSYSYYLLRKKNILENPRNVRILHEMGLLDFYK